MKYEIFINGGFANIPKQYSGEIHLTDVEKNVLLQTMSREAKPMRKIHDGYIYHVKFNDGNQEFSAVFDEHNIPGHVQKFIDTVSKKE